MVVITSPSSSSYCSCWTSASLLGCFGTGSLQLSSVFFHRTSPCLGRSPLVRFACCRPCSSLACRWLCSCLACRWLCSSACRWLCSSRFFFPHCSRSSMFFSHGPHTRVALLHSSLLFTTGSLAVVPSLFFFLLASPPEALLWCSLLLRGLPHAPPTPQLSLCHFVIIGSR